MSADSPSRSKSKSRTHTVFPQQVTDPTILDSVAGFINDVVPASYNIPSDSKDQVQWAHFEEVDNDGNLFSFVDCEKTFQPALVVVLGYSTGVQVIIYLLHFKISHSIYKQTFKFLLVLQTLLKHFFLYY